MSKKSIKEWLQNKINQAEGREVFTPEQKKKTFVAFAIWSVQSVISSFLGNSIFAATIFLWQTKNNPSYLLFNLIPGALRTGVVFVSEIITGIKFSRIAKALSFWPTTPSGYAMPYEIASNLGITNLFFKKIKEKTLRKRK